MCKRRTVLLLKNNDNNRKTNVFKPCMILLVVISVISMTIFIPALSVNSEDENRVIYLEQGENYISGTLEPGETVILDLSIDHYDEYRNKEKGAEWVSGSIGYLEEDLGDPQWCTGTGDVQIAVYWSPSSYDACVGYKWSQYCYTKFYKSSPALTHCALSHIGNHYFYIKNGSNGTLSYSGWVTWFI